MSDLAKSPKKDLMATIVSMKSQIQAALPKHISAERITRIALTALRTNPKLGQCNPESFLGSLMIASQLGLEPNTPLGQCYLIPYGGECQFQLGYKGILDLAYRTGLYSVIYTAEVCEEDDFKYELGFNKTLHHIPAQGPRKSAPIAYYAVYKLKDGTGDFCFMYYDEVLFHGKKFSKSFNSGPWKTHFNAMAAKTCIIKALKYAPKSIELAQAISYEGANVAIDLKASEEHGEAVYAVDYDTNTDDKAQDFANTDAGKLLL